ncbi:Cytochrome oxidase maturation protein, cbb3-type [Sterolibacterium denitrificans]|uniref:Cytochrome oxidase maturation protein, cbb3-type n=1 Tax=Sterolibacterium denitrificans TaxID=157592 RepID=A0A7Z7HRK0_9PROT|nr:cbb3-type cytochrome oxidase assembly protein CcoS [Sterolibacterium denitrificans]SMB27632.1 Cytochrome oxidase maturation protein, cbb3-type [Sterolibacterium denitrificans]
MEILYLLIPISVVLVFLIGIAFWWSLKDGQFDDLEGPGYRILMDDDRPIAADDDRPVQSQSASADQDQKTDKRM